MHQPRATATNHIQQRCDTVDVDPSGHFRIELARFELARTFAIQHGDKLVLIEQASQRFAVCDLTEVARDVLGELASHAYEAGVAVELESEAPVPICGDEALLRVLLRNLVDNAARHAPRGSAVRVRVEARAPVALLCVSDEGPGIPAAERARVLGRFYRALGFSETVLMPKYYNGREAAMRMIRMLRAPGPLPLAWRPPVLGQK